MPMMIGVFASGVMTLAASTALPHPPKTSQNVPKSSVRDLVSTLYMMRSWKELVD